MSTIVVNPDQVLEEAQRDFLTKVCLFFFGQDSLYFQFTFRFSCRTQYCVQVFLTWKDTSCSKICMYSHPSWDDAVSRWWCLMVTKSFSNWPALSRFDVKPPICFWINLSYGVFYSCLLVLMSVCYIKIDCYLLDYVLSRFCSRGTFCWNIKLMWSGWRFKNLLEFFLSI